MRRKAKPAERENAIMLRLAAHERAFVLAAAAWAGSPPSTWCRAVVLQAAMKLLRHARRQLVQHPEATRAAS